MFSKATLASFGTLAVLLLPVLFFPGDDDAGDRPFWERALKRVRKETIATDEADQQTAGYYEDLFEHSSRTISTNRLITGKWATNWSRWKGLQMNPTNVRVDGFLYYELGKNLDVPEFDGRLVTNSRGLADKEYPLEKPAGTRRIGVIGDSVARGLGASHGANFESLLEDSLNAEKPSPEVGAYEVLNFAVGGYRVTQMLYSLDVKAAPFSPDAYLVFCSDLTVFRKWGDHIGQLVHDGIDLHYPYIKELVKEAELRTDDDPATLDAKLEPYRERTLRWALGRMQETAAENGARVVAVLVPTVGPQDQLAERFAGVEELFDSMDLTYVSLLDTFAGIEDLEPYRLGPFNYHPSDAGHARLAEKLLERLRENPEAWEIVTGVPAGAM